MLQRSKDFHNEGDEEISVRGDKEAPKGYYVSMKDLTMSPLSDESIGIIFGRNCYERDISMKMLAQKRC